MQRSSDFEATDFEATDEIVRALVTSRSVRVVLAITTGVAREAARRHQAGPAGALALGRGLTAGFLLATLTKDEERLSLQVLGAGPLGALTVDVRTPGTARAYVKHPAAGLVRAGPGGRPSLAAAIGRTGLVSVIRDVGFRESFSGQISIASGEIDEDVERYLTDSEQIPSALACDVLLSPGGEIEASAGLLVQALPGSDGAAEIEGARALLAGGRVVAALAGGARDVEALQAAVLGGRLGDIRSLDRRPVRFHCPCSRDRAAASLALFGEAELAEMILEDGKADVTCEFCRSRYDFGEAELELIRRETAKPSGPPS